MKEAFEELVKECATTGRVVEKRDIEELFSNLRAKRRRLNPNP